MDLFISLIPNPPKGFQFRTPTTSDLLGNRIALFSKSVDVIFSFLEKFTERVNGIVITVGDTFSHSSIGPELWHMIVTDDMLPNIYEMTAFFLSVMTHGHNENNNQIEMRVEIEDLHKMIEDYKRTEEALRQSETRFRDLTEMLPEAIFETDRNLQLTYANKRAFQLFKYTEKDLLEGVSAFDMIVPEDRERVKTNITRRLQGEDPGSIEYLVLKKDGSTFPILLNASPITKEGDMYGFRGLIIDITQRKKLEEDLKESEEKLRHERDFSSNIINKTLAIICGIAPDGTCTFINPAGERTTGYRKDQLLGKDWWKIFYPGDDYQQVKQIFRNFENGPVLDYEMTLTRKNGDKRTIAWNSLNIMNENGELREIIGVGIDITKRKQMEEDLRKKDFIIRSASSAICTATLDGYITYVNPFFLKSWGFDHPEDVIGRPFLEFWDVGDKIDEVMDALMGKEKKWSGETLAKKKDGSFFNIFVSAATVLDDNGNPIALMSATIDITERKLEEEKRKRAENALKENEENLRITLNSIVDAVIATDINGCIIRMNPVAEFLTGWAFANVLGKKLTDIFHILNAQQEESIVKEVLKCGEVVELTNHTSLIAKDGTEYKIAASGAPIRDAQGNVIGVVLVFRDIAEQLRAEQERLKLKKLESVGLLAGGIAHDFNNLLTGVFGNMELAKECLPADHKAQKFLESAGHSMELATKLTNQLLTFAKGGDPIKMTLSIGAVITDTAHFSIRGSNTKLQCHIAPDLWFVEADKGQLSQVISNLVINAQQAMPTGGTIIIDANNIETSEGRYVQITVQDEGMGIAPKYLDKIFDPYFTTKQTGSGLGLTITHSIISKHNGRITVYSQLNEGTIFTITLPATQRTIESRSEKLFSETNINTETPLRILVLDDVKMVRQVTGAMLTKLGYKVDYAVDGKEAIEKYIENYSKNKPYNLVIADLTIPGGMGGKKAAQEILKMDSQARIIVSSGYATDPVMANYKTYGFKGVVAKPYNLAELHEVIQRTMKI